MVTCNMSSGPRDRKPSEAVRENSEDFRTGNFNYNNHNHEQPTAVAFGEQNARPTNFQSNSNANIDEETPMEVSPTVRPVVHLKINHHDHPEEVHVTLYIKKIFLDSLSIEFDERTVQVNFRTCDETFLKKYVSANEEDVFQWRIETFGCIVPEKCSSKLKPSNLEIKLIKANYGKWESLESVDAGLPGRHFQSEKWISLAPPKTPPRPPAIADGNDNANEYVEPCSPATATQNPVVPARIGYTGLANLGNTCYMNAVLQCLANATPLRNYFIGKSFQSELNRDNPLGFGGSLAVAFAVVLRQLWCGQRDSLPPVHLKTLLANKAPQFSGSHQHDAQEFMAFLLDGLHEDLNRVKNKPYTAPVESEGRPDAVVAEDAWRLYKMRNDSVIVDFFQGQYKSTLVCPSCDKVSVTFDPFLYLALPLPPQKSCFNVTLFIGYDPPTDSDDVASTSGAIKLSLWLDPNERVEHLKREIKRRCANRLRRQDTEIEVVQVQEGRIRRWLLDQFLLSSLNNTGLDTSLFAFETVPCVKEPQVQFAVIQRLLVPPDNHTHCAACKRASGSLKRCLKCFSVAYCDKNCQKSHWNDVHRTTCRFKPHIIGEPFVINLPAASLTYDRLYRTMLHYARFSVEVSQSSSSPLAAGGNDSSPNRDVDSSSSSLPSLPSTPSPPRRQSSHSGSEDAQVVAAAAALQSAAGQESKEQTTPLFFIKPIDSQGQSITGKNRLEDHGDVVLDFGDGESPVFLALDWRNNPQTPFHCVVKARPEVFCDSLGDEDADDDSGNGRSNRFGQRGNVTLQDCLRQFMQPEVLTREEAWYCPKCKEHREATKQMSLWRLPEILTIQLKRFSFRNLLWRDKIDKRVIFPIHGLDLSPYLSTTVPSGPDAGAVYDLFAVVNHYGNIMFGHYTAFARCPANDADNNDENLVGWRCMDDTKVDDVSEERVVTPAAYLLLYRRRRGSDTATASSEQSGSSPSGAAGPSGRPPPESSSARLKYSDPEEID